jgi:hypothetical protein
MINGAKLLVKMRIGFITNIYNMDSDFRRPTMHLFLCIMGLARKGPFTNPVEQPWVSRDHNPLEICIVECSAMH